MLRELKTGFLSVSSSKQSMFFFKNTGNKKTAGDISLQIVLLLAHCGG